MTHITEEWRPVVGWEGWYEVSEFGNVRRVMPGQGARLGQNRSQKTDKRGYKHVALMRNGERQDCTVHSLVAAAFIGPRPRDHEINHRDLNTGNNSKNNLEYVTQLENVEHAANAGAFGVYGERNGSAKLTTEQVRQIRQCYNSQESIRSLSKRFKVTYRTIRLIITNKTWKE